ncbi:MAG: bifunctional D-glycero-beta-D-manno-heptose-7-phosphate kinase/D-glycero-beta-D-manno-heptose 1-phosphate adenylyltransferase HldE [Halothiobacillaceae bacterium]
MFTNTIAKTRLLVVGDLMLDRYWHGPAGRISPEAPVPVVHVRTVEDRPGGAANVALNLAALGAKVTLMGIVGQDEAAATLRRQLHEAGIDCDFLSVPGGATTTKLRVVSRNQQLIRLDFEDGATGFEPAALARQFHVALKRADAVIFSDYAKGCLREIGALIAAARDQGKTVIVDPKGDDFQRYAGASVITPNLGEFEAVAGPCRDEADFERRAETLRRSLSLQALLVTRSEHGMSLFRHDHPPLHQPTHAREVYDVTGAGDTVVATLGAGLAAGLPMDQSMQLANVAAGVVVGKLGTATVSPAELESAMMRHEPLPRGVIAQADALEALLHRARACGERIVMTNGCFDILHAGHVAYLARARALGDRLVVAVNSDDSVRRLKGAQRPVNGLHQRMAVLSGLESVDWVVPFSEDTPEQLICRLKPDVLVKGGDYRPDQIAGGQCVEEHGGTVQVLEFVDGCSTSAIIEAIRKPM